MKIKHNAILIWYNLKGRYDLLIFKNGYDKNKFKKDYKELYNKMYEEEIDTEKFLEYQQDIFNYFECEIIEEFNTKEIKQDKKLYDYIIEDETKIYINTEKLEYGY